jgi:tubulin alpha
MSEILWLHVGQAGCQIGITFWQAMMQEWGVDAEGNFDNKPNVDPNIFFYQDEDGFYIPRAVFIDLDQSDIDKVKVNRNLKQLEAKQFVYGKEDGSLNYSKGNYTQGKSISDKIIESIRSEYLKCESLDCFLIFHSFTGGTGSGMTALILKEIDLNFPKTRKIVISLYPSVSSAQRNTDIYNFALSSRSVIDQSDLNICYDNESLSRFWHEKLNIDDPSLDDLNVVLVQSLISILSSFYITSYDVSASSSSNMLPKKTSLDLITTMVPYPRIKYCLPSMSFSKRAWVSEEIKDSESFQNNILYELAMNTLNPDYFLVFYKLTPK